MLPHAEGRPMQKDKGLVTGACLDVLTQLQLHFDLRFQQLPAPQQK